MRDILEARGASVVRASLFAASVAALGRALQIGNGGLVKNSFSWLLAAAGALALALALPGAASARGRWRPLLAIWLLAAVAVALAQLASAAPGIYVRASSLDDFHRLVPVVAVLAGAACVGPASWQRPLGVSLVAAFTWMGLWVIDHSPNPHIDVFVFQHDAVTALLEGRNPYAITFPNIYGNTRFYAPELVAGERLQFGFPYPPVALVLGIPGVLLGDVRYAALAAMALAGLVVALLAPSRCAAPAVSLLLFHPRAFFVLEQSWTEPFTILLVAVTLACAQHRPRWVFLPAGLLFASKQYLLPAAPLVVLLHNGSRGRGSLRLVVCLGAVIVMTYFPFILWDPSDLWHSVVEVHLLQPFREDALTWGAVRVREGEEPPPEWLGLVTASVLSLGLALRRRPSPETFAAGFGAVMLVLFALSKQAFCNYYALVLGVLAIGIAYVFAPDRRAR